MKLPLIKTSETSLIKTSEIFLINLKSKSRKVESARFTMAYLISILEFHSCLIKSKHSWNISTTKVTNLELGGRGGAWESNFFCGTLHDPLLIRIGKYNKF